VSVELLDFVVSVVQGITEMRGSTTGFTASDRPVIDDGYSATRTCKEISSRHTGDTGADYAYAYPDVLGELRKLGRIACSHPD
jgi:hypothetical protein